MSTVYTHTYSTLMYMYNDVYVETAQVRDRVFEETYMYMSRESLPVVKEFLNLPVPGLKAGYPICAGAILISTVVTFFYVHEP